MNQRIYFYFQAAHPAEEQLQPHWIDQHDWEILRGDTVVAYPKSIRKLLWQNVPFAVKHSELEDIYLEMSRIKAEQLEIDVKFPFLTLKEMVHKAMVRDLNLILKKGGGENTTSQINSDFLHEDETRFLKDQLK